MRNTEPTYTFENHLTQLLIDYPDVFLFAKYGRAVCERSVRSCRVGHAVRCSLAVAGAFAEVCVLSGYADFVQEEMQICSVYSL